MRRYAVVAMLGLALTACGEKHAESKAPPAAGLAQAELTQLQNWLAGNAHAISTLDADQAADTQDLTPFGDAVGDARVVVLNEDSYADKNAFELMNRLVQYLHQHKGFDVLMVESAMFDLEGAWRSAVQKNASVTELAPGRVFYMYSQTDASRKTLQYVDRARTTEHPLILAGLDIPLSGTTSIGELLPALETYLQKTSSPIVMQANWPDYRLVAQKGIELNSAGLNTTEFAKVTQQLVGELCQDKGPADVMRESAGWWCRQVKSIEAAVGRQQHRDDANYDYRDPVIADNVLWMLEHAYPNKKVIIWSNASHGLPKVTGTDPASKQPIYSMGWHLQQRLGQQLYNVKISPLGGKTSRYWDTGEQDVVVDANSVEGVLKKAALTQGFINAPSDEKILASLDVLKKPYAMGKDYKGLFYYPQAVAAQQGSHPIIPLP